MPLGKWGRSLGERLIYLARNYRHVLGLILVLLAFLSAQAMSEPLPMQQRATQTPVQLTRTPVPTQPAVIDGEPTQTPFPEWLVANREQTNGIIIGTVILLLIVIVGTYSAIRARNREGQ
jgi:hypothetical protein